jgi:hypothetical protein
MLKKYGSMRRVLFCAVCLFGMSAYSQESKVEVKKEEVVKKPYEKKPKAKMWRTLTTSSMSGVTFSGKYLQTLSVAVDYELQHNYSISSWSGVNYNYSYNGGWISGQVTLNKKLSKYNIGLGVMYGSGNMNTPLPDNIVNRDISGIFVISRRFKLN